MIRIIPIEIRAAIIVKIIIASIIIIISWIVGDSSYDINDQYYNINYMIIHDNTGCSSNVYLN